MRRIVLDAGLLLQWFTAASGSRGEARALRREYESGALSVVMPRVALGEMLDAVARATDWDAERLANAADALESLGLDILDPSPSELARWMARGMSATEASYAALASGEGLPLVTDDERMLRMAGPVIGR